MTSIHFNFNSKMTRSCIKESITPQEHINNAPSLHSILKQAQFTFVIPSSIHLGLPQKYIVFSKRIKQALQKICQRQCFVTIHRHLRVQAHSQSSMVKSKTFWPFSWITRRGTETGIFFLGVFFTRGFVGELAGVGAFFCTFVGEGPAGAGSLPRF